MAENSKIEWTDHTFNPWIGCTKISPACERCYAESWAKRTGHPELWQGERRRTTPDNWRKPLKWNAAAVAAGVRAKVFCASLADVWDNQVDPAWRRDLFHLIWDTRDGLDWLLLTKRPMNIADMLPAAIGEVELWPWPNVWLGTTCGNREEYERNWYHLRLTPAVVHFISYEPALGPLSMFPFSHRLLGNERGKTLPDWIICGGESGGAPRMMDPRWARELRDECNHHGVAFFFKQMTGKKPIPDDLMVRQFPAAHRRATQ